MLPKVAAAAAIGAGPMLLGGAPIIARIALSSGLYAAVLLALRAFPADLPRMLFATGGAR